jgi:hypothetical protein
MNAAKGCFIRAAVSSGPVNTGRGLVQKFPVAPIIIRFLNRVLRSIAPWTPKSLNSLILNHGPP